MTLWDLNHFLKTYMNRFSCACAYYFANRLPVSFDWRMLNDSKIYHYLPSDILSTINTLHLLIRSCYILDTYNCTVNERWNKKANYPSSASYFYFPSPLLSISPQYFIFEILKAVYKGTEVLLESERHRNVNWNLYLTEHISFSFVVRQNSTHSLCLSSNVTSSVKPSVLIATLGFWSSLSITPFKL